MKLLNIGNNILSYIHECCLHSSGKFATLGLENAKKFEANELIIEAYGLLANLHVLLGNPSELALEMLNKGIEMARAGGYNSLLWKLLLQIAKCYRMHGEREFELERLTEANLILESILDGFQDITLRNKLIGSPEVAELLAYGH